MLRESNVLHGILIPIPVLFVPESTELSEVAPLQLGERWRRQLALQTDATSGLLHGVVDHGHT